MNWTKNLKSFEIYINGTCILKTYSEEKAIDIAQRRSGQLFEQRKVEVVDTETGEIKYQLN